VRGFELLLSAYQGVELIGGEPFTVEVALNGTGDWQTLATVDLLNQEYTPEGNVVRLYVAMRVQKVESVAVRLTNAGAASQVFKGLVALAFEIGTKTGAFRVPAVNRRG
jgi:hypothetical protein